MTFGLPDCGINVKELAAVAGQGIGKLFGSAIFVIVFIDSLGKAVEIQLIHFIFQELGSLTYLKVLRPFLVDQA